MKLNPVARIFQALPIRRRHQLTVHWHAALDEALARNAGDIIWVHLHHQELTPEQFHAKLAHLHLKRARLQEYHATTHNAQAKLEILIGVEDLTREAAD